MGARNKADATIHTVEKALKDVGDKISDDEKKTATEAVAAVKTAMSGDDREEIERKTAALEQASAPSCRRCTSSRRRPRRRPGQRMPAARRPAEAPKDDVLDAEFEEVKESDRKKA